MPIVSQGQTPTPVATRGLLITYLGPQWRRVVVLALLLVTTIGLRLAGPQILRAFIDAATAGAALETLVRIALLFGVTACVIQVTALAEVYVAENVGLTATNRLKADLTRHVLRLDPPFYATHTPGELIERTDGDVATLGNFFSRLVVQLLGNALLLSGILALLAQVDVRVGAVAAACAGLGAALMAWLRRLAVPRFEALRQANADLYSLIEERLAGTEDVRANGGESYVLNRLLERSRHLLWTDVRARLVGSATFNAAVLFLEVATAATLAVGAWLFTQGALTIGTVFLIFAYTQSLHQPLNAIMRQIQDLQQATASIGRVRTLLSERSVITDGPGTSLPAGPLSVELEQVTFRYHGDYAPALEDIALRLEPGQVLGLLGRTGSGKTTLARLLFRLYDPQHGTVQLGGVDVRRPKVEALRARVGVVTQDVQLFHASVRDNVTFFDRSVPQAQIEEALETLGLGPWLRTLPDGIESKLAPGGGGLSAGEAQLLAFARLFLKDPGLVVLDEASSRLDPATERVLEHAVDRLLRGRTAVVIAHRLATVQRADRIAILEGGKLIEQGDRASLAADADSHFSRLLRAGLEEVLV